MAHNWVNFKAIKDAVSMEMALEHYRVNWLRKEQQELVGRCPIHQGEGDRAFHVSLAKNAFNCFSCKARGNVLDFVAAMEKCSVRDAAAKLQEWFSVPAPTQDGKETPEKIVDPAPLVSNAVGESTLQNKPLGFQLKNINHEHPYLGERGITKETAEKFGVGLYVGKGSMSGRVVIPIHNEHGELVAYAGRSIDGSEPRYKLPAGFHKSAELYNLHRVKGESNPKRQVVVVEGFFDCMTVSQAGFPCVALMGSSLSEAQQVLLCRHFRRVVLMLDGDEAGRKAAEDCLLRLGQQVWVRAVVLADGQQPDQLTSELTNLLGIL